MRCTLYRDEFYQVLPPISSLQFHALECVDLSNPADSHIEQNYVLRVDTVVDCDSNAYKHFVLANSLLIVVYQSVPLIWFCSLWRVRHQLNPAYYTNSMNGHETCVESSSCRNSDDDSVKDGRKSIRKFVERISHGLRHSAGQLRSSHKVQSASSNRRAKNIADEALVAKVQNISHVKDLLALAIAFERKYKKSLGMSM
jgi:hypothetical protein